MRRLVEVLVPPRLGRSFHRLLASVWVANLGDGVALAAGPLLIASQTSSAFLVALGALVQWLPPLVFGLFAGVLTDRCDRRSIVVAVDGARWVVLVLLTLAIGAGSVSITVALIALFLLSTGDVFAGNASAAMLPMLVHRDDLPVANARLQTGFIVLNQLAGAPLGALLFAVGAVWAFASETVLVAFAVLLALRIALPHSISDEPPRRTDLRHEVAEGVRWTWRHAAIRTLVLTLLVFNVTFGAAFSLLVLYSTERLHLGTIGFGLITTVQAAGGFVATLVYGTITRYVSLGNLMRIGLVIETLTHAGLALTTTPWVAMVIFFVFGAHTFVWGATSAAIRQRAVPNALQGRVAGVNSVGCYGGLVTGSGMGGVLAQHYGVTTPFWVAFAGSAVFVVLIWGQLRHVAHVDAPRTAP